MIIPQYRAGCPHVTHPSATKIDKNPAEALILTIFVRLACVKHAASVHPEPGSNSLIKNFILARLPWLQLFRALLLTWVWFVNCSVFKVQCSLFASRRSPSAETILPNLSYFVNSFFTLFLKSFYKLTFFFTFLFAASVRSLSLVFSGNEI